MNEYLLKIVNTLTESHQAVMSLYLSANAAIFAVIAFVMKDVPMAD